MQETGPGWSTNAGARVSPGVLLHGFGHSRRAWDPVMSRLATERHVIAIDMPGFGASPWPKGSPFGINALVAHIGALPRKHRRASPQVASRSRSRPALRPQGGDATIDGLFDAFINEQRARLAARTVRNYEAVIGLLRDCLNFYGHQSLDAEERRRWEAAYEEGEDAYVHLFGADKIVDNLDEFLGYFMVPKVAAGEELLGAPGTVTKKPVRWLADGGHLDPAQALASAWFGGGVGPVRVPRAASAIAQPGWSFSISLARSRGQWHMAGVGNVYP